MGRTAVLPANGQASSGPADRSRRGVQPRAVDAFQGYAGTVAQSEHARPADSARRRHLALFQCEGARPVRAARDGDDGFQLHEIFQVGADNRLRDAAVRCDDRRPDALPPDGHGGSRVAGRPPSPRRGEARYPLAHPGVSAGVIGTARGGRADRARRPRMAQLKVVANKTAMSEAAAERVTWLVETAVA